MKNLVLIGMMGCGKTTSGQMLKPILNLPMVDTDDLIVEREGMAISDIFAQKGEGYFRELETSLVRELSDLGGHIIATGGGLPLREENRAALRENGVVFFLNRSPEEIYDCYDLSDRPLAQQGRDAFIQRFRDRDPIYREAAHYVIDCVGDLGPTVEEILAIWKKETEE